MTRCSHYNCYVNYSYDQPDGVLYIMCGGHFSRAGRLDPDFHKWPCPRISLAFE